MSHNLYLFDGSNLGFRAVCAYPTLTLDDFPIGGVYGVVSILRGFTKDFSPGKIVMPFDMAKSRYRLSIFPEYKGHRRSDPKMANLAINFREQLGVMIDLLDKFGICTLTHESLDYEADDAIAYLVHRYKQGHFPAIRQVIIISSDKDLCGLVQEGVVWYNPISKMLIKDSNFEAEFKIKPSQYPDFKALKGDVSDNIPHPRGIGEGHAVKLLNEYKSIDAMLEIKHQKLMPHLEVLALARKLVALDLHLQFPNDKVWGQIDAKIMAPSPMSEDLEEVLTSLKFNSILENWDEQKHRWAEFASSSLL